MMQLPQLLLAALCVVLGVVPAIGFRLMQHAVEASGQGLGIRLAEASPFTTGFADGIRQVNSAVFVPLALAAVLGLMFLLVRGIARLGDAPRRAAAPWLCGYAREAECHRYVAHNFYGEIKRYFRWLGGTPRAATIAETRRPR
jgi:integral membrane sensor domain MASE1